MNPYRDPGLTGPEAFVLLVSIIILGAVGIFACLMGWAS